MNEQILAKGAMLDLLVELKRICEKEKINYFLIGGTLLGAIRHNGYIPWDDDIDVGMLRNDYDRFIRACEQDLNPMYSIENYKDDPYNPNIYHKLKIKNTIYMEESAKNSKENKEIFIDIFPFDNAINDKKINNKLNKKIQAIRRMIAIKCGIRYAHKELYKKIIYMFTKFICIFLDKDRMIRKLIKIETQFNNIETEYAVNCNGAYSYETELFEKKMLENTILHKFEDDVFKIPKEYDYILKQMYRDYMKLPPKSQRKGRHLIAKFSLGNYTIKSKIITIRENENE